MSRVSENDQHNIVCAYNLSARYNGHHHYDKSVKRARGQWWKMTYLPLYMAVSPKGRIGKFSYDCIHLQTDCAEARVCRDAAKLWAKGCFKEAHEKYWPIKIHFTLSKILGRLTYPELDI
jgi:hypothetical protein